MKISVLILCALLVSCVDQVPEVIRIDLEPDQKVSRIMVDDGEINIETRKAYADEIAEEIFYSIYDRYSGARRQRYIVVEHIAQ